MLFVVIKSPAVDPYGIPILDIVVFPVRIVRDAVVAVPRQAEQFGVLVKAVASAGVGNKGEEIIASQVIDPGQWGTRGIPSAWRSRSSARQARCSMRLPGRRGRSSR